MILLSVVPLVVNGGVHREPNAIATQRAAQIFSNTCQKMRGGKHVKVKKRRRQDILRFRADVRKLILGSIGTPLDHLSVNNNIPGQALTKKKMNRPSWNLQHTCPFVFPKWKVIYQ